MELILWRHAEAEEGAPDEARKLTGKGHKQAAKIAGWLERNLPNSCKILASPTKRTVQTVEALERKYKKHPGLAPDASAQTILEIANWPDNRDPVLIVGHQPTLGKVASLVLTGSEHDWPIRKGDIWWISQRERNGATFNYLKAVFTSNLM
jgi:phosphohistidine phosphatase